VCGDMERGGTVDLLYLFAPHVRSSATPWIFCASAAAVHGATCAVLLFAGFDFTDQLCRGLIGSIVCPTLFMRLQGTILLWLFCLVTPTSDYIRYSSLLLLSNFFSQ
jgi:hypothetical protein